jgi:YD repeat-containing protein
MSTPVKHRLRAVFSISMFLFLAVGFCPAQSVQDTTPQIGLLPSNTYQIDKLETIDRVNGNLMYNIPLASLPPVGPEKPFQLSLVYNSQNLRANYSFVTDLRLGQNGYMSKASLGADNGWNYNIRYSVLAEVRPNDPSVSTCTAEQSNPYRMWFQTPDGARHLLILYGYSSPTNDGFYSVDAERGVSLSCNGSGSTPVQGPLTYFTNDGSYIKVTVVNPGAGAANLQWEASLSDGTVVSATGTQGGANGPLTIKDRNGNVTSIVPSISGFTISNAAGSINADIVQASGQETHKITTKGFDGVTLTWTVNWNTINFSGGTGMFTCDQLDDKCDAHLSALVVSSISLPSPTGVPLSFQFGYSDQSHGGWGNLNKVIYPSGAVVTYQYTRDGQTVGVGPFFLTNPVVAKQEQYSTPFDAQPRTDTWSFRYDVDQSTCNQMIGPDNGVDTVCYTGLQVTSEAYTGTVYRTISPTGELREKRFEFNRPFGDSTLAPNPYVSMEAATLASAGGQPSVAAVTTYMVDQNGNSTGVASYDWAAYSSLGHDSKGFISGTPAGTVLRAVSNTFSNPTPGASNNTVQDSPNAYWNPNAPNLRQLVSRTVQSGVGPGAAVEYSYDPQGNLTQTRRWDSVKAPGLPAQLNPSNAGIESRTYDGQGRGNLRSITNPRGFTTTFDYDSNNLFVIKKVVASNAGNPDKPRTTGYDVDPSTGLLKSVIDVDNNVTTAYGRDTIGRLRSVQEALGTPAERDTEYLYEDNNLRTIAKRYTNRAAGPVVSVTEYDQLGRISLSRQLEDGSQNVDDSSLGIKIQTRYLPGNRFNYKLVSNPFRDPAEATMGWTVLTSDADGKLIRSETFAGSSLPAPWGGNTNTTGRVDTGYDAQTRTVTDQDARTRRYFTDPFGRITMVIEDPSGLAYQTSYSYDVLDNLTDVVQAGQTRHYEYNSLKRLTSARNPESGIIGYTYDDNGNVVTRTDPRGNVNFYTYDSLDRIKQKTY